MNSGSASGPAYGVILAGGSGSRFWPLSRESKPKQLLSPDGGPTLLQRTAHRLTHVCEPRHVLVITRSELAAESRRLLSAIPADNVIGEPHPNDTLAAVIFAAVLAWFREGRADVVTLIAPCDHAIGGLPGWRQTIRQAIAVAAGGDRLVTIGVPARWPEPGYGYIRPGARLASARVDAGAGAREVVAFIEKPQPATAARLIAAGCLWNTGIFAWRADALLAAAVRRVPAARASISRLRKGLRAVAAGDEAEGGRLLEDAYAVLPRVSVDRAILEPEAAVAVVEAQFGWLDLGTWTGAARMGTADPAGNVSTGAVVARGSTGNIVYAHPGKPVVLAGVSGLVVVDMPDVLLVADRNQDQTIKQLREQVREAGWTRLL